MVRLDLILDNVGNCDETIAFVRKGFLNLARIQGLLFEKSKQPDKFTGSKTRKSTKKPSKIGSGNKF